jgi:hypothetical protein
MFFNMEGEGVRRTLILLNRHHSDPVTRICWAPYFYLKLCCNTMSHPRSLYIKWQRQVKVHLMNELPTGNMAHYIQRSHCNNTGKRYEVTENSSLLVSNTASVVLSVSKECSASHLQSSSKDLLTNEREGKMFPQNGGKHSLSDAASNQKTWILNYI